MNMIYTEEDLKCLSFDEIIVCFFYDSKKRLDFIPNASWGALKIPYFERSINIISLGIISPSFSLATCSM